VWVCYHDKTKIRDRNDLKLGTLVVIDTVSKPIDSKSQLPGASGHYFELVAPTAIKRKNWLLSFYDYAKL